MAKRIRWNSPPERVDVDRVRLLRGRTDDNALPVNWLQHRVHAAKISDHQFVRGTVDVLQN